VSSIGRCLFNRPVDLSRSISTLSVDPLTRKYGRYRSTVDPSTVDIDIDRRSTYGKIRSISTSTVDLPTVDIDTDRRSTYGKIRSIVDRRKNIEINFFRSLTSVYRDLWRVSRQLGPDLKKSYHHSGPSPMRPNELWTCPDDGAARAQAPGCQRSSCWVRSKRKRRGLV